MEARNRSLKDWFSEIRRGKVRLPRFQRHESWAWKSVASLLETVLRGLPVGAALVLQVRGEPPFKERTLSGTPPSTEPATEHLLDGQQRLTALWRALNADYSDRTYLVAQERDEDGQPKAVVHGHLNSQRTAWTSSPSKCWDRRQFPIELCHPDVPVKKIKAWARNAAASQDDADEIEERILHYRSTVEQFQIPFLSLPDDTPKATAIDVFINMNTSGAKLTAYDIVVAQYEGATGSSLHDQLASLDAQVPRMKEYREPKDVLLDIAALREDKTPTQTSYLNLDLENLDRAFDELSDGFTYAVDLLNEESIFDARRLPTVAVLPVLGALAPHIQKGPDERGNARTLLRSYVWRAFATDRYDRAAATRQLQDFRGLRHALAGGPNEAPIFDEEQFPIPGVDELCRAGWPKNRNTLARCILAATLRNGGRDLADDSQARADNVGSREYHHLFPEAYLRESTDLGRNETYRALNCALITRAANLRIGAKPPLLYLRERIDRATLGEDVIRDRLDSHLIPWSEFASDSPNVESTYMRFLEARAELVATFLTSLCHGLRPSARFEPQQREPTDR